MKWFFAILTAFVLPILSAQGPVKLEPLPKGASQAIGYYSPQRISLSATAPTSLKKSPSLKAPLYGLIAAKSDSGRVFHIVLDEPAGSPAALYVDADGDGDLTNDPPAEWTAYKSSAGYTTYQGGAAIALRSGAWSMDASLGIYRFDKADPSRSSYKDALFYFRDYAYRGQAAIGSKTYSVVLSDEKASGDFSAPGAVLLIDRDADGAFDSAWESYDAKAPFAIDGQSYELSGLSPLGGSFMIQKSTAVAAETKAPPDHAIGKKITSFNATDMEGKPLAFPSDFKGKVVMLDFWATWCGPCMEEVPGLVAAYAKYKDKGFAVLGVTLDNAGQDKQIRAVMKDKGMAWREVYDGKGWSAEIAKLYFIQSIPAPFLVDGDSGEILARDGSLRGASLNSTLEKALKKKGKL